jgi:hypothetical protein
MNREQKRKAGKGMSKDRLEVSAITIEFTNGTSVGLDTQKVMVIDRVSGKPLFDEVLEATPKTEPVDPPNKEFKENK